MTTDVTKSVGVIQPAPPRAPRDYTIDWADQLNRWLINYVRIAGFPAVLRGGRLVLPSLPASGYGLIVGEVYRDGDVLRIVLEGGAYMQSVVAAGSVGTLTVTV